MRQKHPKSKRKKEKKNVNRHCFEKCLLKRSSLLVLQFNEISLKKKVSSPPHFRIQWGYHEREKEGQREILLSNIGWKGKEDVKGNVPALDLSVNHCL